jgi:hypothetical protein
MIVYKLSKNVRNSKHLIHNLVAFKALYYSLILDRNLVETFSEPHN